MAGNNRERIITCPICTKFCQNGDENKLNDLIKRIRAEGLKPISSCDFLKNYSLRG